MFNEGYSAMAGDDWMRPALCHEALRLGRVLAELMPAEPEVHGLVALMEIQASRIPARLDPDGLPVPLPEQNRGRWDQLLIRRGFTALLRAQELGGPPGPYVLQAAIASLQAASSPHIAAPTPLRRRPADAPPRFQGACGMKLPAARSSRRCGSLRSSCGSMPMTSCPWRAAASDHRPQLQPMSRKRPGLAQGNLSSGIG